MSDNTHRTRRTLGLLLAFGIGAPASGQTIVYVNAAAPPGGNGVSWATAYNSLQAGLATARAVAMGGTPAEVWVAAGVYKPSAPLSMGGSRNVGFTLATDVSMYGGFAGTETSPSQRLLGVNITTLSGDLNGDDAGDLNLGDNTAVGIVNGSSLNRCVVDGVTITAGNTTSVSGAGVAISGTGSFTLRHCVVINNRSPASAGLAASSFSTLLVERCRFIQNRSTATGGGGVQLNSATAMLRDCEFIENTGSPSGTLGAGGGGARVFNGSSATFDRCRFIRNTAPTGGGVAAFGASQCRLVRCEFFGNTAGSGGAVWGADRLRLTMTGSLVAGNSASAGCGAIFNTTEGVGSTTLSFTVLNNCTIAGNHSGGPADTELTGAVGLVNLEGHTATVSNCIIWGNTAANAIGREAQIRHRGFPVTLNSTSIEAYTPGYGVGTGNDGADPSFLRPVDPGPDAVLGTLDDDSGDLRPGLGSGAIDSGNNTLVPADTTDMDGDGNTTERIPFDLLGQARFIDDPATIDTGVGTPPIVDRGVYEAQVNCPGCPGVREWRSAAGGNWNSVGNWNPAVPGADSDTLFGIDAAYTVTFDPAGVPGTGADNRTVHSMSVSGGSVTLDLNQTTLALAATQAFGLTVGDSPSRAAALTITDGTLSAVNARVAAAAQDGSPTPVINSLTVGTGGNLVVTRSLTVGAEGRGEMTITGGGRVVCRDGTIGDQPGSRGLVSVNGTGSAWDIPFFCIIDNGELNVSSGGAVNVGAGIPFTGIFLLNDGRISGDGTINGNVVNFGEISPGNSPGTLTINGGYAQVGQIQDLGAFSGRLDMEIAGAAPGQFDQLAVNGDAELGGGMFVRFAPGFQPAPADTFRLLATSGLIGAPDGRRRQFDVIFFPALTAPAVQGKFLRAGYTGLRGPGGNGITIGIADLPPGAGFGPPQSTSLGDAPAGAAIGDLDRDGDLDIAIAMPAGMMGGSIAILINDGAGGFAVTQIPSGGVEPLAIAIADFDGASGADIAVAHAGGDTPEIRLLRQQSVAGTFGSPVVVPLPAGSRPVAIAAGDLDFSDAGNAGIDLVAALEEPGNDRGSIAVARNTGGNFASTRIPLPIPMTQPLDIRPTNPDRDKDLDLCASFGESSSLGSRGGIAIFGNVGGTGIFGGAPPAGTVATGAGPVQLLAGRLDVGGAIDASGGEDLVTVNRGDAGAGGQSVSVLRNTGDFSEADPASSPGFAPSVEYGITFEGGTGNADPSSIALADLDDDGDLDLAVVGSLNATTRRIKILRNDSTRQTIGMQVIRQVAFAPQADQLPSGDCPVRLLTGDISGDQRADLVSVNRSCSRGTPGSVSVARNTLPPLGPSLGACCAPVEAGGACTLATEGACLNRGDAFQGAMTACAPSPCPQPPAACCRGSTCLIAGSVACAALGPFVRYAGAGTTCNAPGNPVSPCCRADFNQSGGVSVQDIFDFLGAYFAGEFAICDINSSGTLSVQDIFDFLALYFLGCD